jgi:hypothetical protein
VITIWVTYFIAAVAASGIFIAAGWRSKQARRKSSAHAAIGLPNDPLWEEVEIDPSDASPQADAGAALRLALKRVAPVMVNQFVQAEVAASSGLIVRMRGAALTELLEEMLVAAIHAAPASRILLTAAARGERVAICITDDVPNADPDLRRAGLRSLMERAALRGGLLDVEVRPDEGTTMTLRLNVASADIQERQAPEPTKGVSSSFMPQFSSGMTR